MAQQASAAEAASLQAYTKESARRHLAYSAVTTIGYVLSALFTGPISYVGNVLFGGAISKRIYNFFKNLRGAIDKKHEEKRGSYVLTTLREGFKAGITCIAPPLSIIGDTAAWAIERGREEPLYPLDYELKRYEQQIREREAAAAQQARAQQQQAEQGEEQEQ